MRRKYFLKKDLSGAFILNIIKLFCAIHEAIVYHSLLENMGIVRDKLSAKKL